MVMLELVLTFFFEIRIGYNFCYFNIKIYPFSNNLLQMIISFDGMEADFLPLILVSSTLHF